MTYGKNHHSTAKSLAREMLQILWLITKTLDKYLYGSNLEGDSWSGCYSNTNRLIINVSQNFQVVLVVAWM